jgi:hypothetical protein
MLLFFPMLFWLKWLSNLEPNQVIFKRRELLLFYTGKIKKKWILILYEIIEYNED